MQFLWVAILPLVASQPYPWVCPNARGCWVNEFSIVGESVPIGRFAEVACTPSYLAALPATSTLSLEAWAFIPTGTRGSLASRVSTTPLTSCLNRIWAPPWTYQFSTCDALYTNFDTGSLGVNGGMAVVERSPLLLQPRVLNYISLSPIQGGTLYGVSPCMIPPAALAVTLNPPGGGGKGSLQLVNLAQGVPSLYDSITGVVALSTLQFIFAADTTPGQDNSDPPLHTEYWTDVSALTPPQSFPIPLDPLPPVPPAATLTSTPSSSPTPSPSPSPAIYYPLPAHYFPLTTAKCVLSPGLTFPSPCSQCGGGSGTSVSFQPIASLPSGTSQTCATTLPPIFSTCTAPTPCAVCDSPRGCGGGLTTCPRCSQGQTCTQTSDCSGPTLFCSPTLKVCAPLSATNYTTWVVASYSLSFSPPSLSPVSQAKLLLLFMDFSSLSPSQVFICGGAGSPYLSICLGLDSTSPSISSPSSRLLALTAAAEASTPEIAAAFALSDALASSSSNFGLALGDILTALNPTPAQVLVTPRNPPSISLFSLVSGGATLLPPPSPIAISPPSTSTPPLSPGGIVGIVCGVLAACIFVTVAVVIITRRKPPPTRRRALSVVVETTTLPFSVIGSEDGVPGPEYEKASFGPTKAHMSRSLASSSSLGPASSSVGKGGGGGGGGEGGGGELQSPLPDAPPSTVVEAVEVVEVVEVAAATAPPSTVEAVEGVEVAK